MKKYTVILGIVSMAVIAAQGQILFSTLTNATYIQNFDTMAKLPNTNMLWVDNTELNGWYAARQAGNDAPYYGSCRISDGSMKNGWIYSFGSSKSSDRAFGSVTSSFSMKIAFGVRFKNDTPDLASKITISYTGEQWRNGGEIKKGTKSLIFSYQVSSSSITNIDVGTDENWKTFEALDFKAPVSSKTIAALDGNAVSNRTAFSKVVLPGVVLKPGDELFLRWVNIPSNKHGLGVDDFSLTYTPVEKK